MGRARVSRRTADPADASSHGTARVWTPADLAAYEGPLLLDTHVWIWHLEGDETRFAKGTSALLDRSGAQGRLFVCDISWWEVAVKAAKGKLQFSMDAAFWLRRAERAPGIVPIPLSREILLMSTRLPGQPHGDPADRMLLATAQLQRAPLVTVDEEIIAYARRQRGIPVCDARA